MLPSLGSLVYSSPLSLVLPLLKSCLLSSILYVHVLGFLGGAAVKSICKAGAQETQVQFLGWEEPLEEETATHSNILSWRIPWAEEPVRLQFMGLQRVRHN